MKLTTLNTKVLLAAIAAVAGLGVVCLLAIKPEPVTGPGQPSASVPAPAGPSGTLQIWAAPQPLPEAVFTAETGEQVGLSKYRGKVVLMNFWATWCEPCRTEMPTLAQLQAKLAGADFTVIAVSADRTGKDAVLPYLAENKLTGLPVLYDPTLAAAHALGVRGFPTSILISRDGKELGRAEGPLDWVSSTTVETISKQIAGTKSATQ